VKTTKRKLGTILYNPFKYTDPTGQILRVGPAGELSTLDHGTAPPMWPPCLTIPKPNTGMALREQQTSSVVSTSIQGSFAELTSKTLPRAGEFLAQQAGRSRKKGLARRKVGSVQQRQKDIHAESSHGPRPSGRARGDLDSFRDSPWSLCKKSSLPCSAAPEN